jgi:iron-sulfur cluster assembly protein
MLQITDDAIDAIKGLMAGDAGGVRITTGGSHSFNGAGPALQVELATTPDDEDQVIQAAGAQLFVDPDAASRLDEKVLDARVRGDHVQFEIRDA